MRYSPLAIHCTSLCFDVIQGPTFISMKHEDIDGFHDEVYMLITERSMLSPALYPREHAFVSYVTDGVLRVLHQCLNNRAARDPVWIMTALESRIEFSIRTTLQ